MDMQLWTFSYLRIKRDVNKLMKCMYMEAIRRNAKICVVKVPIPQDQINRRMWKHLCIEKPAPYRGWFFRNMHVRPINILFPR